MQTAVVSHVAHPAAVPKRARDVRTRASALTTKPIAPAAETVKLGKSGLEVSAIGIGAWSWGDRSGYWGYGKEYGKEASKEAHDAILRSGINFLDTAEVYGFGKSEEFVGEFARQSDQRLIIATKFPPIPFRFTAQSVVDACKKSLQRLDMPSMGLYMQHWPGFLLNAFSNDEYIKGLLMCQQQGLCQAVGVSNFNPDRIRSAARFLEGEGVPLASNQIQYSLIYRKPESSGVIEACREHGVTVVAYSPLGQGLLTGKYGLENRPTGPRSNTFTDERLRRCDALVGLMREVGEQHGGKTPAQVAINWVMCKGALPIPGAKSAKQVEEAAGAFGWRLTEGEMLTLEEAAKGVEFQGAPFEAW